MHMPILHWESADDYAAQNVDQVKTTKVINYNAVFLPVFHCGRLFFCPPYIARFVALCGFSFALYPTIPAAFTRFTGLYSRPTMRTFQQCIAKKYTYNKAPKIFSKKFF